MRAHADGSLPFADLDVEPQLAVVLDLAQVGANRAGAALHGGGDVLDADLEANGGLAVGQVLEGEDRRVALHHRDHPWRREDARADRAADVGHEAILDDELVASLESGLDRHWR